MTAPPPGRPVDLDAAERAAAPAMADHAGPTAAPSPDGSSAADPSTADASALRWVRPVVWLLVTLLAGVGIGAAVTTRHSAATERVRAETDRSERAVLGLQAGSPDLARGAGLPDSQGRSTLALRVSLSNRGADPVRVRVLGVDVAGRVPSGRPAGRADAEAPPLTIAPGASTTTSVPVAVRCRDVLPPAGRGVSRGARGSTLEVSVEVPGGPRRAALPLSEPGSGTVGDIVSYACAPPQQRRAPVSVTWTPRDDGSLEVAVSGSSLADPLSLGLQQTPGLGVSSDQDLPVPVGTPTVVVLTMAPTCSAVAVPGEVPVAGFEVVTLGEDRQVQASVPDDDGVKAAWTARQLALSCG